MVKSTYNFTFLLYFMIMPFVLCLYLVAVVIDPIVTSVWTESPWLLWKSWIYLIVLVLLVLLFQREFKHLAEKEQTKLVFTPRVFSFFAYACAAWCSAWFTQGDRSSFLSLSVVSAIGLYRLWSWVFDFYPLPTRQSARARWFSLFVLAIVAVLSFLPSITAKIRNIVVNQWPLSTTETQPTPEQWVAFEEIIGVDEANAVATWVIQTWWNEETIPNTGEWKSEWIWIDGIVTYAKLLSALDEQWVLPAITQQPEFTLINKNSPLYQSFQRAWWLKLVWTNINPDRQVRCENLMVILWIIQEWQVTPWTDILWAYRSAAEEKNALWNCTDPKAVAKDIVFN